MVTRKLFSGALLLTVCSLFTVNETNAMSNETLDINVKESQLSIDYLDILTKKADSSIKGFEIELEHNGENVTFGYELGNGEALNDAIKSFKEETNKVIAEFKVPQKELILSEVNFEKKNQIIEKLENSGLEFKVLEPQVINSGINALASSSIPSTIANDRPLPYEGKYSIMEATDGNYAYQDFIFSKWEIDGFKGDPARNSFEMDTVFYNYDGKAYSIRYGGTTKGTWWNTNLPSPYLDTDFGDDWAIYGGGKNSYGEANETNFSVGTSDADELVAEKTYYYNIKLVKNTRSNIDYRVKVNAQPGKQYTGLGVWGAFSYYTTRLVPFTKFKANEYYSWRR